ncbi:preprotein translocase subunit YajC [Candidatus Hydrogenedentota bacterium]
MLLTAIALAQDGGAPEKGAGGGSPFGMLPIMVAFFIFMYFLMIKPQKDKEKKRIAMISALKKGDKVMTTGGMMGTVSKLTDTTVIVKVAENVKIEFTKNAVVGLRTEEDNSD